MLSTGEMDITKKRNMIIVLSTALVGALALFFVGPIPQDLHYHCFADGKEMLGIPNFWNVVSNLPFAVIGAWGLISLLRRSARNERVILRTIFAACFLGIFLTCFGSAWYHLNPTNETLLWDRMPMTLVFMPFFSLILYDYVGNTFGKRAFWILTAIGIGSVLLWYWTETIGEGDLRLYLLVQFYPMLAIPLLLIVNRGVTNYGMQIVWVFFAYVAAKLCETFDVQIYELLGGIGGHPIKHIFAGLAAWYILRLMQQREVFVVR